MMLCLNYRGKGVLVEEEKGNDDYLGESVSRREIGKHLKRHPTEIKEEASNLEEMNSNFQSQSRRTKKKSTKTKTKTK